MSEEKSLKERSLKFEIIREELKNSDVDISASMYSSAGKLWSKFSNESLDRFKKEKIRKKDVNDFAKAQIPNQLFAHVQERKSKDTNFKVHNPSMIRAQRPRSGSYMDILDMHPNLDNGFRYILVVIDTYSRKVFTVPLKTRKKDEVKAAYQKILDKAGDSPFVPHRGWVNVNLDNEFKYLEDLFQQLNTKTWYSVAEGDSLTSLSFVKNSLVERFNRTLRVLLKKWMVSTGSKNWTSILDQVIHEYNTTVHSSSMKKPEDIWNAFDYSVKPNGESKTSDRLPTGYGLNVPGGARIITQVISAPPKKPSVAKIISDNNNQKGNLSGNLSGLFRIKVPKPKLGRRKGETLGVDIYKVVNTKGPNVVLQNATDQKDIVVTRKRDTVKVSAPDLSEAKMESQMQRQKRISKEFKEDAKKAKVKRVLKKEGILQNEVSNSSNTRSKRSKRSKAGAKMKEILKELKR